MKQRSRFLLVGHRHPDEDCMASLVAFSLLLDKFGKSGIILTGDENWKKFPYLMGICKYNSLAIAGRLEDVGGTIDAVIAFDTPKPSMLEFYEQLGPLIGDPARPVIEIDHHLEADGTYIGDDGLCMVDGASSTCELIGYIALKIDKNRRLKKELGIDEIFTRNFVLSIITGIVGDSKMGQFLKSRREKRYYRYFSRLFNRMLMLKTNKNSGNFCRIEDILEELEKLSGEEAECHNEIMSHTRSRNGISWIALNREVSARLFEQFDPEIVVNVAKYAANNLAENSGFLSLVAYYDHKTNLIQLRMRRCRYFKEIDLRDAVHRLEISDGGGHEGAVGFRIPAEEVQDFDAFITGVLDIVADLIGAA